MDQIISWCAYISRAPAIWPAPILHLKYLSLSLVVGDALCLGGAGLLGGEGQHHQRDDIRQHPVNMGADADLRQPVHAVAVDVQAGVGRGNALEQAEQQRCSGDIQRLPVTEDHNRQRQEAEACHVAVGGAVGGGQGVDEAAHAGQRAGNGGAGVAHFVDIDAQTVRCLGILTAGAQPQAKPGLVQNDGQDDENQNADIGRQVHLVDEGFAQEADVHVFLDAEGGLLNHEPGGGVAGSHLQSVLVGENPHQEQHQRGSHHVQSSAAYGLVGLQIDGGEGQEQ